MNTTQMLANFLRVLPLPTLLLDEDGRILAANAPAQEILGNGITGRHYITALRQPPALDAIERALVQKHVASAPFLSTIAQSDVTYRVECAPFDIGGASVFAVSFHDETDAQNTQQMRSDFVADVSHELKTPLTSILGFIETLQGPAAKDPNAQARFLDLMQTEARRMDALVRDLLSLNRVEADERLRPTDMVDVQKVIADAVQLVTPLAQTRNTRLVMPSGNGRFEVTGDAAQLTQVVRNLLENAVLYSPENSAVTVHLTGPQYAARLRREALTISVIDQGVGIDPLHLPRVTERFYRVDDHRARAMGGTGLGLAIVKHIINRHNGRLEIESQVNHGSTFHVILPISAAS
ncbi:ATP-binding protein [Nereida sp. MMG025]|uniref:ATP-binding protein n=1 Tax=Nereida sp. MMG025 TaxID=2909981 RepID=UPI001F2E4870|nr:ATP-binding protein [Nereida sp. MMG025]MCF6443313.1 ATP-binding protein [Nereida sp. MMG025]